MDGKPFGGPGFGRRCVTIVVSVCETLRLFVFGVESGSDPGGNEGGGGRGDGIVVVKNNK